MDVGYEIPASAKTCFRYVVPFMYDDDFEAACHAVEALREKVPSETEEVPVWIPRTSDKDERESDLYAYVRTEFRFQANGEDLKNITGKEWCYRENRENGRKKAISPIASLLYLNYHLQPDKKYAYTVSEFCVTNVGLVLFQNKLGMFWYELQLPGECYSAAELILFQNRVRELTSRDNRRIYFWEKTDDLPEYGISVADERKKKYYQPFFFGSWVCGWLHEVHLLNVTFFAQRNLKKDCLKKVFRNRKDEEEESPILLDESQQGKVTAILFHHPGPDTPERTKKSSDERPVVPDKALLFTYAPFEKTGRDTREENGNAGYEDNGTDTGISEEELKSRCALIYHLTNGYSESYHLSQEVARTMAHPFSTAIWYATQEGAAYLAWPAENNRIFFLDNFASKVQTDYFTLYLNVLYQSYSLLIYAQRIQHVVPYSLPFGLSELKDIRNEAGEITEQSGMHAASFGGQYLVKDIQAIQMLYEEISVFLTKSMATSVSHIHHQSSFYNYLKRQLRIREDVESITAGLNSLGAILQEHQRIEENRRMAIEWKNERDRDRRAQEERELLKKEEKKKDEEKAQKDDDLQAIMGLFALLGVFSALTDSFDFISKIVRGSGNEWLALPGITRFAEVCGWVIIGVITVLAVRFSLPSIKTALKNIKKKKEEKKE